MRVVLGSGFNSKVQSGAVGAKMMAAVAGAGGRGVCGCGVGWRVGVRVRVLGGVGWGR